MAGAQVEAEANGTNGNHSVLVPVNGVTDSMNNGAASGLSKEEIELYDRQLRLWGAQAQERIRNAHILLVSLRALGTEIAKNLTLAGIRSLTIVDETLVTKEDLGAQYFLRDEDIGKPRAQTAIPRIQELNPRVTIQSDGSLEDMLQKDPQYYMPFDCIIACDHDFNTLSLINTVVRLASRPFYAAGLHGFCGWIFADLYQHEFVVERARSNVPTKIGAETLTRVVTNVKDKKPDTTNTDTKATAIEEVWKSELYCPLILANSSPLPYDVLSTRRKLKQVPPLLPCLRALFEFQRTQSRLPTQQKPDIELFLTLAQKATGELLLPAETLRGDFVKSFIANIGNEIVPTAAFVGGRLSEDVINVLGRREQPIQNFALFDGEALDARIYSLYTTPPEALFPDPTGGAMLAGMPGLDMGMGMGPMDMGALPVDVDAATAAAFQLNGVGAGAGLEYLQPAGGLGGMGMEMDLSLLQGGAGGMVGLDGLVGDAGGALGVGDGLMGGLVNESAAAGQSGLMDLGQAPTSAPANGEGDVAGAEAKGGDADGDGAMEGS